MRTPYGTSLCMLLVAAFSVTFSQGPQNAVESGNSWSTSDVIAGISAGAAIFSMVLSIIALFLSGKANIDSKKMFKRQGVIDLHMAWSGTNQIDPNKLVTPDVVKGVNALSLTAALWNHDVIEKEILYQSYWPSFRDLYETLHTSSTTVPGTSKKCRELLTSEIVKAYEDMKKVGLNKVIQTSI